MAASAGAAEGRQARGLLKVMAAAGGDGNPGSGRGCRLRRGRRAGDVQRPPGGDRRGDPGHARRVRPPAVRQPGPAPGRPAGPARPGRGRQRPDEPRPVLRLRGDGRRPGHGRLLPQPGARGAAVRRPRPGAADPGTDPLAGHRLCRARARARQPARPRRACDRRRHRPGRHRRGLPRGVPRGDPRRVRRRAGRPGHLAGPRRRARDLGHRRAPARGVGRWRASGSRRRSHGPRSCARRTSARCPRSG